MSANKHNKSTAERPGGLMVVVRNGNVDKAMRKLKNKCKKEGLFQDLEKHRFFDKPSVVRNRNKAIARKRHLKKLAKRFDDLGY